jgi:hypothetical protein
MLFSTVALKLVCSYFQGGLVSSRVSFPFVNYRNMRFESQIGFVCDIKLILLVFLSIFLPSHRNSFNGSCKYMVINK